jgi:hypothetical protein
VTVGISGGRSLTRPLRDARRFPSTRWCPVSRATRTTRKLEICPSFKGFFCRPVPNPKLRFAVRHRCNPSAYTASLARGERRAACARLPKLKVVDFLLPHDASSAPWSPNPSQHRSSLAQPGWEAFVATSRSTTRAGCVDRSTTTRSVWCGSHLQVHEVAERQQHLLCLRRQLACRRHHQRLDPAGGGRRGRG